MEMPKGSRIGFAVICGSSRKVVFGGSSIYRGHHPFLYRDFIGVITPFASRLGAHLVEDHPMIVSG